MRNNPTVALHELLSQEPPDTEPTTRRQARARRRRRTGPLAAGIVVVAAAATGSAAALMSAPGNRPTVAGYPSGSAKAPSPAAARAGAEGAEGAELPVAGGVAAGTASSGGSAPVQPSRISQVPDRPAHPGGSWPALTYTLESAAGRAEPPTFPGALQGFALQASGRSTVRVSQSRYFTAVGSLPVRTASYSECRRQRFYVRWLALDPRAVVDATFVDEGVHTVQNTPVRGAAGWMSSYGCVQPALRIRPTAAAVPSQAMVIVETQVWRRR
ncbi:MAG: hypothetical protein WAL50_11295 [Kineosporiaceae bacterium]